jgi:hypothetical protein
MTAREAIAHLRASRVTDPMDMFLYLALHFHELRLSNNRRLLDSGDFKEFLLDLAEAMREVVVQ